VGGPAAARWAELQSGRGIPPEILAAAEDSPWCFAAADFVAPEQPVHTPSRQAGLELLAAGGTVLDVGCGGGAAAFALVPPAVELTGVDQQPDMLASFTATAAARGVPQRTVLGRWPDCAEAAGRADVVVTHHVLHNVVELPPFLQALTGAARRGVVVEMLAEHPMAWLDPLWGRFHGLHRPPSAGTDDAVAVLREMGIEPAVVSWERTSVPRQDPAWVTRRLCLPSARTAEVAAALDGLVRPRVAVTLRWQV
jgi:SAM-dependent methyltransferase